MHPGGAGSGAWPPPAPRAARPAWSTRTGGPAVHGDRHARHAPDLRAPDARAAQHDRGGDVAGGGPDRVHAPVAQLEPGDLGLAPQLHTLALRVAQHRVDAADGLSQAVAGHVVPAEDARGVDERHVRGHLVGRQQRRVQTPRRREPVLALQLTPPCGGRRDLDAAYLEETRFTIDVQSGVELDRVARQLGHHLRGVGLEHQTRGVRRRATRLGDRALVHHDDVGPAELGQVVGGTGADHACTDDDDPGTPTHPRHLLLYTKHTSL